jgi:hypothetical protein
MKPKQQTIYAPIATASHLFRLAGGEQAPQQACADIAALINRGFAIVPMALPARADPDGHGGVTITDANSVQHNGRQVPLRSPGPDGVRLKTVDDDRVATIVRLVSANPKLHRTDAWNAVLDSFPDLTERQFQQSWAQAHQQLQLVPKPGPKRGQPITRRVKRQRNPRPR